MVEKMFKKSKKKNQGQVASTLTWFIATFVILFIMILFALGSGVIAGRNFFSFGGKNKVEVGKYESNVLSNNILYSFLKKPTEFDGKKQSVENLISRWADETNQDRKQKMRKKIIQEINNLWLIYGDGYDYIFNLESGDGKIRDTISSSSMRVYDPRTGKYVEEYYKKLSEKMIKFVILSDRNVIKGGFYLDD